MLNGVQCGMSAAGSWEMADFRLDKSVISVVPLSQADDELEYWLSKTPEERWQAVEFIRRTLYGYSDPPPRLQRVLEVVERSRD
jgi:hypothetical protein